MRHRPAVILMLALGVTVLPSLPVFGQASPAEATELAASVEGADLPYAVRAKRFLGLLGLMAKTQGKDLERPPTHLTLATLGLDPDSAAGLELLDAAIEFREAYDQSLEARNGLASEEQQRMEQESCRLAGRFMGRWLQAREAEGWALDPLLQRLLNSPYWGSTSGTTGSLEELKNNLDACAAGFNQALATHLPDMPRSLRND